jgi:hypothetical protein
VRDRVPVIDYESRRRPRPWWVLPVVREVIALILWQLVLLEVVFAGEGVATFTSTHGTRSIGIFEARIETAPARVGWIVLHGAVASAIFIGARWHAREWDADLAAQRAMKTRHTPEGAVSHDSA